jgi:phosphoribosylglycinamide formyltransferase-1
VSFIIANNPNAFVLERAKRLGIESAVVTKAEFVEADGVIAMLRERNIDFVVLAGFLLLVPAKLIQAFPGRIVNIHPALLPSFPGLDGQGQALEYGVKFAGCTVHFVDEGTDSGPIILQKVVPVLDDDTHDTLAARILEQEHIAMPEALKLWAEDKLVIEGRKVRVLA